MDYLQSAERKTNFQPRILYPIKLSFMNKDQINIYSDNKKLNHHLPFTIETSKACN